MDIGRLNKNDEASISTVSRPATLVTSIPFSTNGTRVNETGNSSHVMSRPGPTEHVLLSSGPQTSTSTSINKPLQTLPDVVLAQKCRRFLVIIVEACEKDKDLKGFFSKDLVQSLLNGGITEELFLEKLLKNSPHPHKAQLLLCFLKKSLSPLKRELANKTLEIPGIIFPAIARTSNLSCPTQPPSAVNPEITSTELEPKPADYEEISKAALRRIMLTWKNITDEMKQAGIEVVWNNDNECATNIVNNTCLGSTNRKRKLETEVIEVPDSDSEEIRVESEDTEQSFPSTAEPHFNGGIEDSLRKANANVDINAQFYRPDDRIDISNHGDDATRSTISTSPLFVVSELEVRLIGVMSAYLQICPLGATEIEILSFIQKIISTVTYVDIQNVLTKFPILFKQENVSGETCENGRIWKYVGYHS